MTIDFVKLSRLEAARDAMADRCMSLGDRRREALMAARTHHANATEHKPKFLGDSFHLSDKSAIELLENFAERFTPIEKAQLSISIAAQRRAATLATDWQKATELRNEQGSFFITLSEYVAKVTQ